MKIQSISANYWFQTRHQAATTPKQAEHTQYASAPMISYLDAINFTAADTQHVQEMNRHEYKYLTENQKRIWRKKCERFERDVNVDNLATKTVKYLPLMDDKTMKGYIDICKYYSQFKDHHIICLGRSPKWFLDTAKWMKGGIKNYNFVAFSDYWHRMDHHGNPIPIDFKAPTAAEKKAYKSYLNTNHATPKDIIKIYQETGKKVIITDYVESGKGACSFLDLLSEYAEDDGVLEEFANSIKIVAIGSLEYRERFFHEDEEISIPTIPMPDRLCKYSKNIEQTYKNMPLNVFMEMLWNQNTNECRSSYYPPRAWTIYKPYNYKTGKITDAKIKALKTEKLDRSLVNFNPTLRDYKNLLNFRILDYLNQTGQLRE